MLSLPAERIYKLYLHDHNGLATSTYGNGPRERSRPDLLCPGCGYQFGNEAHGFKNYAEQLRDEEAPIVWYCRKCASRRVTLESLAD